MTNNAAQILEKPYPRDTTSSGTHCSNCNEYYFPPRNLCPNCRRSAHLEEHTFKGTGTIVTYTTIYNATEDF